MRIFDHPNLTNFTCPLCNTNEDYPVTLIGIEGSEDGNIVEAVQVHIKCLKLLYYKEDSIIAMFIR